MAVFDLHAELRAVTTALEGAGIAYAVCGALALAVYGHPRATKDVDLLVDPTRIDDAKRVLAAVGYGLSAAPMSFRSGVVVHRISRVEGGDLVTVDLLVGEGPLASAFAGRQRQPWLGTTLSVVTRAGLVEMKRLAGRPQDRADLAALGEDADD